MGRLINSIWQTCLVAVAPRLLLAIATSSQARYADACAALLIAVAAFAVSFVFFFPQHQAGGTPSSVSPLPAFVPGGDLGKALKSLRLQDVLRWISLLWIAGVFVFNLRNVISHFAVWR
jgi:hypothetical protein